MSHYKILVLTMAVALTLVFGVGPTAFGKNDTQALKDQVAANTAAIADNQDDIGFLNNLFDQHCPSGQYVTDIDSDGFIQCAPAPALLPGYEIVSHEHVTDHPVGAVAIAAACPTGKIALTGSCECWTGSSVSFNSLGGRLDSCSGPGCSNTGPYPDHYICECGAFDTTVFHLTAYVICIDDPESP